MCYMCVCTCHTEMDELTHSISQQPYMLRQIVCTILFSSRWWIYRYKLFSVFEHCKNTKFWWNTKSMAFSPILMNLHTQYLNNRTCCNKIVCTILFSSTWWICWSNCLVFWVHCENGKILMKRQVYNKGILPILGTFSLCEILISSESTFHPEWNGVINFVTSCSVVELLVHKNPASYSLVPHTYTHRDTNMDTTLTYTLCVCTIPQHSWSCESS